MTPARTPLNRATAAFKGAFASFPHIAALAPARVNIIGEHIDYNGGTVLPFAINHHCAAVVSLSATPQTTFIAADLGERWSTDQIDLSALLSTAPLPRGSWPSYIAGVVHHLRLLTASTQHLHIAIASDVPRGSGLSSSAALELSIATALNALLDARLSPLDLAKLCQRAEHSFAGVPCGLMDQAASALCKPGFALQFDCRDNTHTHVPLPDSDRYAWLIADTGVRHALAHSQYAARRRDCEAAAATLKARWLCWANSKRFDSASLPQPQQYAAIHAITELQRTLGAGLALVMNDLRIVGRFMRESHVSLRDIHRVSCPELDTLAAAANACPGVLGARMTGAGFGGCIIALVDREHVAAATAAMQAAYMAAFQRECTVFEARSVGGAHCV